MLDLPILWKQPIYDDFENFIDVIFSDLNNFSFVYSIVLFYSF